LTMLFKWTKGQRGTGGLDRMNVGWTEEPSKAKEEGEP